INRGITYTVAGKTGTAQVFGIAQDEEYDEETVSEKLRDHALFISYAPAEDPRIAVAVIVENGEHGSTVAAPIARQVMDAWLQQES
ncbi:MAG: penicillin-binding transpeptidase domain-containing protein, partial [Gammaproteobacteria bacterium]|nr:penicillin-binding transpeptidase domain-containing protein [Gammaproteobacteria bacterium]